MAVVAVVGAGGFFIEQQQADFGTAVALFHGLPCPEAELRLARAAGQLGLVGKIQLQALAQQGGKGVTFGGFHGLEWERKQALL